MAKYKVYFTVKDNYGKTKEVEGGTIDLDVGFTDLDQREVDYLEEALPLENYLKKSEISAELDEYATDTEVGEAIQNNNSIKYTDFDFKD
jgi:hypothetical protein